MIAVVLGVINPAVWTIPHCIARKPCSGMVRIPNTITNIVCASPTQAWTAAEATTIIRVAAVINTAARGCSRRRSYMRRGNLL